MTKDELIAAIAQEGAMSKTDADRLCAIVFRVTAAGLKSHGDVKWPHVGTLTKRVQKARKALNPRTGEKIDIPEKKVVRSEQSEEETRVNSPADGNTTRETRTANYEIDKTVMKVISAPGSNRKRVSVSVAVDGRWEKGGSKGDSAIWKSRTPEEMTQLTELVKSAVGATPGNDNIYVTNVRFENPAVEAQVEELTRKKPVPWDDIAKYGIAILALIAGFFFLKGLLKIATEAANPPAPNYASLELAMADEEELENAPVNVNDMLAKVEAATKADPLSFSRLVRSWLTDDSNKEKDK